MALSSTAPTPCRLDLDYTRLGGSKTRTATWLDTGGDTTEGTYSSCEAIDEVDTGSSVHPYEHQE
jgi:hypothetical protein